MIIIVVDDEKPAMEKLVKQLTSIKPSANVIGFLNPLEALEYSSSNNVEIAFLDIEMYGICGLDLAKKLKEVNPCTNVIFVTGYASYAVDAFKIKAQGYILKPASNEDIIEELQAITPMLNPPKKLRAHTFGNFEVFYNDVPIKFRRSKSKELLAYLIDRKGAACTTGEIITALWEERRHDETTKSLLRNVVSDLISSLRNVCDLEIIIKSRNSITINTCNLDCDYYNFLNGDARVISTFSGEYMLNYSWGEMTAAYLYKQSYLKPRASQSRLFDSIGVRRTSNLAE